MITIVAKLQANPGKEEELKQILLEMIGNVKEKEAGKALVYSLHVADNDPTLFLFYEQYANATALEEHGQTEHMKAMGGKLGGLLAGRPVIERYTQIGGVS